MSNDISKDESINLTNKRIIFGSAEFMEKEIFDHHIYDLEGKTQEISVIERLNKSSPLIASEESIAKLAAMLSVIYNDNSKISQIELSYKCKDSEVNLLMFNLHGIISETENIKRSIPKPLPPKPVKKTNVKKEGGELDVFNISTMSKRSLTSNRSKMLGYKSSVKSIVVPNKYSIISPKVSINIGMSKGKSGNIEPSSQVEISLEDKSKLKASHKFERDLDTSLNSSKASIKKIGMKKSNQSGPLNLNQAKLKFGLKKVETQQPMTSKQESSTSNLNKYDDCISIRTCSSNFKFEPKKKNMQSSIETLPQSSAENTTGQHSNSSNMIAMINTRNMTSQELSRFTSKLKTGRHNDTFEGEVRKFLDFKSAALKSIFVDDRLFKIESLMLSFLAMKELNKIKLFSSTTYKAYNQSLIAQLQLRLEYKRKALRELNPFKEIIAGDELINKIAKVQLNLNDFLNVDYCSKYIGCFIHALYAFIDLADYKSDCKSIKDKADLIHEKAQGTIYNLYHSIILNLQSKNQAFELLKKSLNTGILDMSFVDLSLPNQTFRYFNDFFRVCRKILEEDRKTECLLDCELLEDKMEKFKSRLFL